MSQPAGSSSSASSILKQQMEATSKRLDHLIQSAKWKEHQEHLQTLTSNVSYLDLKELKKSRKLPRFNEDNLASYPIIPSTPFDYPHALKDYHGMTLAYRFPIPTEYITTLSESQPLLPPQEILPNPRDNFLYRHYPIWADYSKTILESRKYRRDHPRSQQWL
ncbi:hypothetical protein B9Z19DRAFT_1139014 [Tuber borchii]|uniref:Uncharacterized protein n=1 Tax=Tuber borchii TaxID=42251 RepID=A0A2T6Z9Q6_TUBBO|nr:hypothetical protein B9Z19DRAFT_1139014 [Tuber borchii]